MNSKFIAALLCLGFVAAAGAEVNFDQGVSVKDATHAFGDNNNIPLPKATVADTATSRFDSSGCSVQDQRKQNGPVTVSVTPIPRNNCWNFGNGSIFVEYKWTQANTATPEKNNIGFWFSLNGSAQYQKASSYNCKPATQAGYSPDTSGNNSYICAASTYFQFRTYPNLLNFAYNQNGGRNIWDTQVAVSLDDNGNWDSLNGRNYSFRF